MFRPYPQALDVESGRRMYCQQRTEHGDQVLLRLGHGHGLRETSQSNVEEFLNHLVAYDALAAIGSSSNQQGGFPGFRGRCRVE